MDDGTSGGVGKFDEDTKKQMKGATAEEVAKMVFEFVNGAKAFAAGMNDNDDVRLLRMRTKRHELMIVPGKCRLHLSLSPCSRAHIPVQTPNSYLL